MDNMVYIISGSALLLGAAVAWLYARSRSVAAGRELEKELDVNREKLAMAGSSLASVEKNLEEELL